MTIERSSHQTGEYGFQYVGTVHKVIDDGVDNQL